MDLQDLSTDICQEQVGHLWWMKALKHTKEILSISSKMNRNQLRVKEKYIYQMQREIASLMVKFKDMENTKASYCVEKGDKPQSNSGYQFGGLNQKRSRIVDWIIGNISLLINLVLGYFIFMLQSGAQCNTEKNQRWISPLNFTELLYYSCAEVLTCNSSLVHTECVMITIFPQHEKEDSTSEAVGLRSSVDHSSYSENLYTSR